MRKSLFVFFFLAFCWAGISAQQIINVLYLKNGWIIRGKLLKNTPDSVKIESNCGNTFVFNSLDVLRIENEKKTKLSREEKFASDSGKTKIYSLNTFGFFPVKSEFIDAPGFSLRTQIGYQFSNYAGIALGTGIENYDTEVIPVFVSFKSEWLKSENTPVLILNIGYSFPLNKNKTVDYNDYSYTGGICAGFDLGILAYKTPGRAFNLSVGYQYQHIIEKSTSIYTYNNSSSTNTYDFNKLIIKLGYLFK